MLRSAARSHTARTTRALLVAGLAGVVALLAGCGTGQIAQTAAKKPSVPGANAELGGIALRNVQIAYPGREQRSYPQGGSAPLDVRIFNSGAEPDTLVAVRSEAAERVVLVGAGTAPSGACPGATASVPAAPASPAAPGATPGGSPAGSAQFAIDVNPAGCAVLDPDTPYHLVLTGLRDELAPGDAVPVTFTFREAGEITVDVPFGLPTEGPEHSPLDIHPTEPPVVGGHEGGAGAHE